MLVSLTDDLFCLYALIVAAAVIVKLMLSQKRWLAVILQVVTTSACATALLAYNWQPFSKWLDDTASRPGFHAFLADFVLDISTGCGLVMVTVWKYKRIPLLPIIGCIALITTLVIAYINTSAVGGHIFGLREARSSEYVAVYFYTFCAYAYWVCAAFLKIGVQMIRYFGGPASAIGLTGITISASFATVYTTMRFLALNILCLTDSPGYEWYIAAACITFALMNVAFIIGSSFPLIAARQRIRRDA